MEIESIQRRATAAKQVAQNFRSMYEECYKFGAPNHNSYTGSAGSQKSPMIFDSICTQAMDAFVNLCINTITPTHTRWAALESGVGLPSQIAQLNKVEDVTTEVLDEIKSKMDEWLGDITEDLFAYLNTSNLYSALGSFYYDVCVGTGCLLAMQGDERFGIGSPLNFRAIPTNTVAIEEGAYGEISAVFREIKAKRRDIKLEWEDIGNIGDETKSDDEELVLEESTIFEPEVNVWVYRLLYAGKQVLERKYQTNPWIIFRWSVIPGEVWGRGPMAKALPDAAMLNAMVDLMLRSSQLSAIGCYTGISDDIINPNSIRILPGAIIPVKRNAGPSGPSLQPLPGVGNINIQASMVNDIKGTIRRMLLDENLPTIGSNPNMTATEVVERVRKIQKDFGAVFGRISYELLQPIIQRTMDILINKGLLQMPPEFSKIDSFLVKMKIVSPIARLQSMQDVESLTQVMQILGTVAPELVPQQVKIEKLGPWLADKLGAPQKFIKTESEQEAEREQAMLQQQAQEQAQLEQQALQQQGQAQQETI